MGVILRSAGDRNAREYELFAPLVPTLESGREEVVLGLRATPASPRQPVVVTIARREREGFEEIHARLLEHAQDGAFFIHPNVTSILDVIDNREGLFLVLEHVDGTDLASALSNLHAHQTVLPAELAAFVCHEVLKAMHHLHTARDVHGRQVVMTVRDIAPDNVLVSREGRVKLANRTLAAALERKRKRTAAELFARFAPECIAGEPFSVASDIYGMGVLLYELLIGERCFPGATREEVLSSIVERGVNARALDRVRAPLRLEAIVERATFVVPERRFRSALEMSQALEQYMREAAATAPELGPALARLLKEHGALDGSLAHAITSTSPELASQPRLTSGRRSGGDAPAMLDATTRPPAPDPDVVAPEDIEIIDPPRSTLSTGSLSDIGVVLAQATPAPIVTVESQPAEPPRAESEAVAPPPRVMTQDSAPIPVLSPDLIVFGGGTVPAYRAEALPLADTLPSYRAESLPLADTVPSYRAEPLPPLAPEIIPPVAAGETAVPPAAEVAPPPTPEAGPHPPGPTGPTLRAAAAKAGTEGDAIQERTLLIIVALGLAILTFILAFVQYRERTMDAFERARQKTPIDLRQPKPPRR